MSVPIAPFVIDMIAVRAEAAILAAGERALGWFRPGARTSARIDSKDGGSPVTEADHAVDAMLARDLPRAPSGWPAFGYVSEETILAEAGGDEAAPFWLVDPIDGTRSFLGGDDAWSISVALIAAGRPIWAMVHAPARGETLVARRDGGARRNGLALHRPGRLPPAPRLAGPRPLVDGIAARLPGAVVAPRIPSLALRLAAVAHGAVDAALASPGAHCWDVAAADLILAEAGAGLVGPDAGPLAYRRRPCRRGALVAAPASDLAALAALLPVEAIAAA